MNPRARFTSVVAPSAGTSGERGDSEDGDWCNIKCTITTHRVESFARSFSRRLLRSRTRARAAGAAAKTRKPRMRHSDARRETSET